MKRQGKESDNNSPPIIYGEPDKEYKVYTGSEVREYTSIYITRFLQNAPTQTAHIKPLKHLEKTALTLIGLGTLGFYILFNLLQFSIPKISVVDDYIITATDSQQRLFPEDAVGKQRYTVYQTLFDAYPLQTRFEWYPIPVEALNEHTIPGDSDLLVLCSDTNHFDHHNYLNELCVRLEHPWMSVRWGSSLGEIGPSVIPRKTACFKCYEYRLKANVDEAATLTRFSHSNTPQREKDQTHGLSLRILANYTSLEIIKLLTGYRSPQTINAVITIDCDSYRNTRHPVLRVPYCPVCYPDYKKHR